MKTYTVKVYNHVTEVWYKGHLHCEHGPAIRYSNGSIEYCINGKLHNTTGPALAHIDGREEYWIKGVKYTKEEFLEKTNPVKEVTIEELEAHYGCKVKIVKENENE